MKYHQTITPSFPQEKHPSPASEARPKSTDNISAAMTYDLPENEEDLFKLEQFALLDSDDALKNCGNKAIVMELLTLMIHEQLPHDLRLLKEAYSCHDALLIEKLMHKIKGGALYAGTIRMRYACQYVERYRKNNKIDLFEKLYSQAIDVIEQTSQYVARWIAEHN